MPPAWLPACEDRLKQERVRARRAMSCPGPKTAQGNLMGAGQGTGQNKLVLFSLISGARASHSHAFFAASVKHHQGSQF
eukprot:114387-Pelagomonas_calceolata.AAC.1